MAKGLGAISSSQGNTKLLAAYGNDIVDVDAGTGYGLNLSSSNNVDFEPFLDRLFFQNFNHTPLTYSPDTNSWSNQHVKHTPIAKFQKEWDNRMYLGYVNINSTEYASRVVSSDLPTTDKYGNFTIQWGFQSGTNGSITANTNRLTSAGAGFKTYGIKVGDPLTIESGANAGQYTVSRIASDLVIETVETFTTTQSNITFWVGSNWFDVKTNNSDVITGLSENSSNLLIFKQETLHRYNRSSLKTVRGPGTSSHRSIVYFPQKDINIYFHGSSGDKTGVYMYDGTQSINISRAIQPFIDGIAASFYSSVVAWPEGDIYRIYVGDITNQNSSNDAYNISLSQVVLSYSIMDNKWSIDPISDVIACATQLRESGALNTFIATSTDEVFQTPSGYSFDNNPIAMAYETKVLYPSTSDAINVFDKIKVIARDAGRVEVYYKLWNHPFGVDQTWRGLGNLDTDMTELVIPKAHNRAAGIQLRFVEYGTKEPVPTIERYSLFYTPETLETPERRRLT